MTPTIWSSTGKFGRPEAGNSPKSKACLVRRGGSTVSPALRITSTAVTVRAARCGANSPAMRANRSGMRGASAFSAFWASGSAPLIRVRCLPIRPVWDPPPCIPLTRLPYAPGPTTPRGIRARRNEMPTNVAGRADRKGGAEVARWPPPICPRCSARLSLGGSGQKAPDKEALEEQEDQHRDDDRQEGAGREQVPTRTVLAGEVVQHLGNRKILTGGEDGRH
jgi:hypothetical protein